MQGSARDILAQAEVSEDNETRSQTSEATEWLEDFLKDGPAKANDAIKKSKGAGISEKSLRTACLRLRVRKQKSGYSGGWMWSLPLPEDAPAYQDAQDAQPSSLGALGAFDEKGRLENPRAADAEVF